MSVAWLSEPGAGLWLAFWEYAASEPAAGLRGWQEDDEWGLMLPGWPLLAWPYAGVAVS